MPADVKIRFHAESASARRDLQQLQKEISELRQELGQTQRTSAEAAVGVDTLGDAAHEAAGEVEGLRDQLTKTAEAGSSVKVLTGTILTATQALDVLTPTLQQSALAVGGSSGLTGLMRSAAAEAVGLRDEIEALEEPFTQFNISLADASEEQQRLTQFSREFIHELNVLERISRPFEVLHADINLVNPAISDAAENMRLYIRVMDDVQDEFQEIDTLSERLTASIRNQASAFDELRSSVGGVPAAASGLPGQQLGSGVFDQFDARTPGSNFGASFGDSIAPVAAQLGQELASQAIRTAGELRRIEQDRIEDLQDLEREYSEQIVAINERKRERLAAVEEQIENERMRRVASIEAAFQEAADAEVEARQDAADRILDIEARAAAQRQQLRDRLNDRLIELEQRRDDRIQNLTDGFIEREQDRQQQILEITENAAQARAEAEQQYADSVQAINNRLVEQVIDIQRGLQGEIESLESEFVGRQADRAAEIVRITQDAADARAAANETYTDTMQGIYNNLVEAWDALEEGFTERQADRAEERITIEQNAADARVAAYETYNARVAQISTALVDEIRGIHAEIAEVEREAAAERVQIEQDAVDARRAANQDYTNTVAEIEADRDQRLSEIARRITDIEERAVQERGRAQERYNSTLQGIYNDLVDTVRDIQVRITEATEAAAAERLEIEEDYVESVEDIEERKNERLEENTQRLIDIQERAAADRLRADEDYAERFQDIQNGLVNEVVDIQRDLNDTLNDLRDEQLDAEQDRLDSLVDLHADAQQRLEDLERDRQRTVEDLREEFRRDRNDAAVRLDRDLRDADSEEDREEAIRRYNRRIQDVTREFYRDNLDLQRNQARAREDLARQTAETREEIARRNQERLANIAAQETSAREGAQAGIAAAEAQAGVSFAEAQANYVPETISAHEQALVAHAEALNAIAAREQADTESVTAERATLLQDAFTETTTAANAFAEALKALNTETEAQVSALQGRITDAENRAGVSFAEAQANYVPETISAHEQALQAHTAALQAIATEQGAGIQGALSERAEVLEGSLTAVSDAGMTLAETLSSINEVSEERLSTLQSETAGTLSGLQGQISAAEGRAGLTFEQALQNYTPAVNLNTQALNTLNETLAGIDADAAAGLSALGAAGIADRATTSAAQAALETEAGVSIEAARVNFVPALSSAAQATRTLNETIRDLDASFKEAIATIQTEGLVDQQVTDAAIADAVANAIAQQTALETQAGTTFAEASAAFQPGLSDIAQAGVDRDTTLSGIDAEETAALGEIGAQSIADRLQTDAEITQARDEYIKTRDTAIFQHNTAILALNTQEAQDIAAVKVSVQTHLTRIDQKLDTELEEIRATKMVFDTKISELITSINEEANTDVSALQANTEAMRESLENIADEARNNAWKSAILSIANTGIQVTGIAVGAAVGAPQQGAAIGQVIGNLVEQGGNELFHYERTDRLARSIARQETLRRSRETPSYFPSREQIQNSRDISREIVAGIQEAQRQGGGGGVGGQPIEITVESPPIVLNEEELGRALDSVLVSLDSDGRTIGEYLRRGGA